VPLKSIACGLSLRAVCDKVLNDADNNQETELPKKDLHRLQTMKVNPYK
jgi:hypothetical protein